MHTRFVLNVLLGFGLVCGCRPGGAEERAADNSPADPWDARRMHMIDTLKQKGIEDAAVLDAMAAVKRHAFIPVEHRAGCDPYGDHPCPIGFGQTISQPFVVAYMTAAMKITPGERVLEIGTGSGYQAAILAAMGAKVYSIEIVAGLAEHARKVLPAEGFDEVALLEGDGYKGWPEHAPFDVVIVTCAPEQVPDALIAQLKEGGRMIVPVGTSAQRLVILKKVGGAIRQTNDLPVRFVPMVHGGE